MQFSQLVPLVGGLLLSQGSFVAAEAGFAGSCIQNSFRLNTHGDFEAICSTRDPAYHERSNINLNLCIVHRDADILPGDNGNFMASCRLVGLRGRSIEAVCPDAMGVNVTTELDLNTVLFNSDGILACFGHYGQSLGHA
ncbi:hypothetical protein PG994_002137 [Apiospora phragmitis]|uniref:Cyanovirin-N domain-containing protein n=1 Tax=Apiospora phragmitis TaxID=2905665 RepID=A0ABR1WVL1_9PEZI